MSDLTRAVMRYKQTGSGFEEIKARMYLIIYDYPKVQRRLDADISGDFLMYMMPRIEPLIERYQRNTVAFEGYLNVCLRWRLKSFLRQKQTTRTRRAREVDPYVWQDMRYDSYAEEPDTAYGTAPPVPVCSEEPSTASRDARLRRIREFNASNKGLLFFCLKAICDVDDTRLPSIASLCGVSVDWLTESKNILTTKTATRRARLALLRKRQETLYSRLRDAEERLATEYDPVRHSQLRIVIARLSQAYRRASHEASRTNLRPSNTDIAEMLHVPKGTVDSGVTRAREVLTSSLAQPG